MTRIFSALDLSDATTGTDAASESDGDRDAPPDEIAEVDAALAEADADDADGTPHEVVLAELDRLHTSR